MARKQRLQVLWGGKEDFEALLDIGPFYYQNV